EEGRKEVAARSHTKTAPPQGRRFCVQHRSDGDFPGAHLSGESREPTALLAMDIFLQQLINGVTLGSVYALVALGYTMVYGIFGIINFAPGEVVMIGAMVSLTVVTAMLGAQVPLPFFAIVLAGLLVAIPVCMAIAFGMERIAYRPLRKAPRLAPLITAIGMS